MTKTFTIITTNKCNLNCTYCYEKNKNNFSLEYATGKKIIDFLFKNIIHEHDDIRWNFFGGEPLLEAQLINQLLNYIYQQPKKINNKIGIVTNGTLLNDKNVLQLIKQYSNDISISLSIDGNKSVHDLNRDNSYENIVKNIPFLLETTQNVAAKLTLNDDMLPCLCDCVKNILNLGIRNILVTPVSEIIWNKKDEIAYKRELYKIADLYVINKFNINLFNIDLLNLFINKKKRFCNAGTDSLAFDINGDIFPCHRFVMQQQWKCGDINDGINQDKILPLKLKMDFENNKCKQCQYSYLCRECIAYNYLEHNNINIKSTNFCGMFKIQIEANYYLQNELLKRGNSCD